MLKAYRQRLNKSYDKNRGGEINTKPSLNEDLSTFLLLTDRYNIQDCKEVQGAVSIFFYYSVLNDLAKLGCL